jgi:hypothetical protein
MPMLNFPGMLTNINKPTYTSDKTNKQRQLDQNTYTNFSQMINSKVETSSLT